MARLTRLFSSTHSVSLTTLFNAVEEVVNKLSHFKREFRLPEKLDAMLLKYPGIFYIVNEYQVHTVLLIEGYNGSELIYKDLLFVVNDKFGELMQQGLYEYNHWRYQKKHNVSEMADLREQVFHKDHLS